MITTVDNPYNPFDNFKEWYVYDTSRGYHSTALLGRIVVSSDELSEADQALAVEQAVDEIVLYNVTGKYKKVTREFPDTNN